MVLSRVKRFVINLSRRTVAAVFIDAQRLAATQRASYVDRLTSDLTRRMPENIVKYGYSVYSQNEEDGIINRINSVLGIDKPTFIEFGVHATENNTLNLLLRGSRGAWIDKGLQDFKNRCPKNNKLLICPDYITVENILGICERAREFLRLQSLSDLDLLCLDLDGNDYHFIEALLKKGCTPRVFCLEYNAKFVPPHNVCITYDAHHVWRNSDDYFGCSLQAYIDLLGKFGYILLTCNLSGSNCFFIRKDLSSQFVIYEAGDLHQPPRPFLSPFEKGNRSSEKFVLQALSS